METEETIVNSRHNLAQIIGYDAAMIKIVCRKLEYIIDHPHTYMLGAIGRKEMINALEQLKETYRVSEYLFDHRTEKEYDYLKIKEVKQLINNQNTPNENGRTNNLDASTEG